MSGRARPHLVLPLILLAPLAVPSVHPVQVVAQEDWGRATAEKLAAFLPATVAGLIERMPWDPDDYAQVALAGGCGETGCPAFARGSATRRWRMSDPGLVRQLDSLDQQEQQLAKRAVALGPNARPEEYVKLGDELEALGARKRDLQDRARWLTLTIEANSTVEERDGLATPVGTLKGHPMYRYPWDRGVRLSVYLGPSGFSNPVASGKESRRELKSVLVYAEVYSAKAADAALGRQLLERVDYPGLARLLQP